MAMMKTAILPLLLGLAAMPEALAAPARLAGHAGTDDCQIAPLEPAPRENRVDWNGMCKDGFASGTGTLEWKDEKGRRYALKGSLLRGELQGEGELKTVSYTYTGTLRRGKPHGNGYIEFVNGNQYEGDVIDNKYEGKGILVRYDRSEFKGEWKNGQLNGWGEATYSLGGSYAGQWKDDKPHGRGIMTFAGSNRKFDGQFEDGRPAGIPAPVIDSTPYFSTTKPGAYPVTGPTPVDATWEALTEGQRNRVRIQYPALEQGDDPPYPRNGTRKVFEAVHKLNHSAGNAVGDLLIRIIVGADGKAKQAMVLRKPTLEDQEDGEKLVKYIASVMMLDEYKPAMCRGAPCEMAYATYYSFTVVDTIDDVRPPMFR
ncbi:hypothetical protein G4G28_00725 [Massilia sp. Dwa41.01b]|uniref:MORN repeat-containing protein n=1 Tax=unclassified Massilia TaxID=2609279 RepID=UPI0016022108|nr:MULTISPECIES: hypothetical protein [unclassified Massilia]QNA87355.1 hypothetical protein G4G28_00725 [Massilia sp. Dwa41.01b]QNA98262.1 hypothetical protein G4G31_04485 [Massilia sp. Se16.2.3]